MAWNASNPVPWKRLCIEWLIIGSVVAAVSFVATDNREAGSYLTIPIGGAIYVLLGALLAKFGYSRKTLKQIRAAAAAVPPRQVGAAAPPTMRPRPAPTSRTSGGPPRAPAKKRR
jgi:hypothetical protein